MEKVIEISVIVPTRNRAALLDRTINSLLSQSLSKEKFEVLVVDNGSTDDTKAVCNKYAALLNLKYIYAPKPGLHEGRHAGFKAASSDYLTFCDDDIEAFPSWLETIVNVFNTNKAVALVGGKNYPKYESAPPDWIIQEWTRGNEYGKILSALSILDFGEEIKEISPGYVFGCNFSIRKSVLQQCEGFHPDGMPFELIRFRGDGETYVSKYIHDSGMKALYHPGASVYHFVSSDRMTEAYFKKRYYIQGVSDAYTFLRNQTNEVKSFVNAEDTNRSLKSMIPPAVKRIIKKILFIQPPQNKVSIISEFDKQKRESHKEGYNYLIQCYQTDTEVKEWVHKKNYLS